MFDRQDLRNGTECGFECPNQRYLASSERHEEIDATHLRASDVVRMGMPGDVIASKILQSFLANLGEDIFMPSLSGEVRGMRRTSVRPESLARLGERVR
jgi:hypothetical protein